jgi:hypothetical protein
MPDFGASGAEAMHSATILLVRSQSSDFWNIIFLSTE